MDALETESAMSQLNSHVPEEIMQPYENVQKICKRLTQKLQAVMCPIRKKVGKSMPHIGINVNSRKETRWCKSRTDLWGNSHLIRLPVIGNLET
jgi:hypothetical protein